MTSISTMMLMIHICAAVVGLLSGFLAMIFRKGSGLHRTSGSFFFVSMLVMSASAVYLATRVKPNMLNMTVGLLTCYLVTTAWRTGRRREIFTGAFDLGALLFVSTVATAAFSFGLEAAISPTGSKNAMPAPIYFIFGTVAFLCAVSDVRMLVRGELSGGRRIVRHLWRMCLALLIATLSLYPGQAKLFPDWLKQTSLLFVPHVLLIGSMILWRFRMRSARHVRNATAVPSGPEAAPVTQGARA